MSTVENSTLNVSTHYPFEQIANSQRLTKITSIALVVLITLMIAMSAWSTVQVASVYGSGAIVQHATYTTLLPLSIILIAGEALASLTILRHHSTASTTTLPNETSISSIHSDMLEPKQESPNTETLAPQIPAPVTTLTVSSRLPGQCRLLNVHVGDTVKKGDILFVMECMKMEHAVTAEEDGKISEIYVTAGATLDSIQPILLLEKI
ncbi:MAG TPA: acetyl-CoA carboxylase biotin carboxyl carrier protein subunit [Waddliaceae bacterium]